MSKVILNPEYEELLAKLDEIKDQLSIALEERADLLNHQYKYLKTEYITKIGTYEYKLFELDCDISRIKRKIDMVQAAINLQTEINLSLIDCELDKEYKEYLSKLEEMAKDIDIANLLKNFDTLTLDESKLLTKLYKNLAKLLHPDLNANLTDEQRELWIKVVEAYEDTNLDMLKMLMEVANSKANNIINMNSKEEIINKIGYLNKMINDIINDIEKILMILPTKGVM